MKKGFLLITTSIVVSLCAQRPGATFLLIPPSARATAMAYANTAVCDDASANYYNGAGLAFLESPAITAQYCGYLSGLNPDMHYMYFAVGYPLLKSAWGFDFIYFTPGKHEVIGPTGVYLGESVVWRIAPKITYARRINERLACGLAWKFIYQKYAIYYWWWPGYYRQYQSDGLDPGGTGSSWAFDFNALYKIMPNLSIGTVLHNIGPKIYYTDTGASDPLPWTYRLGLAYTPINNELIAITFSTELTKVLVGMFAIEENSFWENVKYEFEEAWKSFGLEMTFYRILSLRGGYFYDREGYREGFTFGGGVSIKGFEFSIGIDENLFEFPTENRKISLSYTF